MCVYLSVICLSFGVISAGAWSIANSDIQVDYGSLTLSLEPSSGWMDYFSAGVNATFTLSPPCQKFSLYRLKNDGNVDCLLGHDCETTLASSGYWKSATIDSKGRWVRLFGMNPLANGCFYGICAPSTLYRGDNFLALGVNPRILDVKVRLSHFTQNSGRYLENEYTLIREPDRPAKYLPTATYGRFTYPKPEPIPASWLVQLVFRVGNGLPKPTWRKKVSPLLRFFLSDFELPSDKYYGIVNKSSWSEITDVVPYAPYGEELIYSVNVEEMKKRNICSIQGYAVIHLPGAAMADIVEYSVDFQLPEINCSSSVQVDKGNESMAETTTTSSSSSSRRCKLGQFQCKTNGNCVLASKRCDGTADCYDGSDEEEGTCMTMLHHTPCPVDFFTCLNGRCVDGRVVCDGTNDCGDRTDEHHCGSHTFNRTTRCSDNSHFACRNRHCILAHSSMTVSQGNICNGKNDCGDNSDEYDCGWYHSSFCQSGHWRCRSGECVAGSQLCDGHEDCHDSSDEWLCGRRGTLSSQFSFEVNHFDQICQSCSSCAFFHGLNSPSSKQKSNSTDVGGGPNTTVIVVPIVVILIILIIAGVLGGGFYAWRSKAVTARMNFAPQRMSALS